jgi:hypothetical protein
MIRKFLHPNILRKNLTRSYAATQPIENQSVRFEDEWANAKPFESIPRLSKLQAIRAFMPGGKFKMQFNFQDSRSNLMKHFNTGQFLSDRTCEK